MLNIEKIKQLRHETDVSYMECKKALEQSKGDLEKAKDVLKKRGKELAEKKSSRDTNQGIIVSYIHPNKKIGVLLEINCETDFVSKSQDFQNLAHELCLQIAAYRGEKTILEQSWIKDEKKTIKNLLEEYIAKSGENITLKNFARYEL